MVLVCFFLEINLEWGSLIIEMNGYIHHSKTFMSRLGWHWLRVLMPRLFAATFFLGSCGAVTIGSQVYGTSKKNPSPNVADPNAVSPNSSGASSPRAPGVPGSRPAFNPAPRRDPEFSPPTFRPASRAIPGIGIGHSPRRKPRSPSQGIPGIGTGVRDEEEPARALVPEPATIFESVPETMPFPGSRHAPGIGVGTIPSIGTSVGTGSSPGSGGFGQLSGYRNSVFFGSERRLRVGVLLPLSGKYAVLGNNLLMAAKKAREDYRQLPIDLVVADSGGTPEQTRMAMQRLMAKQVRVVVGPVFSSPAQEALAISSRYDLPLITLNPNQALFANGGNSYNYAYLNAFHQDHQARIMARFAIKNRRTRVAILAPDHAGSQRIIHPFTEELESLGGRVVKTVLFPKNSHDFSKAFKELGYRKPKEHKTSSVAFEEVEKWANFNALFIPAPAKTVRLIAPQAAFFGLMMPQVIMIGTSLWDTEVLLSEGTIYLMDAVYCDIDLDGWKKFSRSFKKRWKVKPRKLAVLSYDGVAAVAQLYRDQRSGRGSSGSNDLLRERGFKGIGANLRFLNSGLTQREYKIFQVGTRGARPYNPSASKLNLKYKRYWWSDSDDTE